MKVYFLGFQKSRWKAREAPTMDTLAVGLVLLGIAIFGTVVMFFLFRSKQFQDREVTWMKSGGLEQNSLASIESRESTKPKCIPVLFQITALT